MYRKWNFSKLCLGLKGQEIGLLWFSSTSRMKSQFSQGAPPHFHPYPSTHPHPLLPPQSHPPLLNSPLPSLTPPFHSPASPLLSTPQPHPFSPLSNLTPPFKPPISLLTSLTPTLSRHTLLFLYKNVASPLLSDFPPPWTAFPPLPSTLIPSNPSSSSAILSASLNTNWFWESFV